MYFIYYLPWVVKTLTFYFHFNLSWQVLDWMRHWAKVGLSQLCLSAVDRTYSLQEPWWETMQGVMQFRLRSSYELNLLQKCAICFLSAEWQECTDFLFVVGGACTDHAGYCLLLSSSVSVLLFQEQISCLIFQQISTCLVCICLDVSSLTASPSLSRMLFAD